MILEVAKLLLKNIMQGPCEYDCVYVPVCVCVCVCVRPGNRRGKEVTNTFTLDFKDQKFGGNSFQMIDLACMFGKLQAGIKTNAQFHS